MKIPGESTHTPPSEIEQWRLQNIRPYVREAYNGFRPTWHIGPRRLLDYLLVQILDGSGTFTVGDHGFTVSAGDLVWVPPDTPHEMEGNAPGNELQYIHFDLLYDSDRSHWSAMIPDGVCDLDAYKRWLHPPLHDPVVGAWQGLLQRGDPAVVSTLLRQIILRYQQDRHSGIMVAGLVSQLVGHLLVYDGAQPQLPGRQAVMERAMQAIQLHGGRRLNLDDLARQHGMSTSHFRSCFRAHFGQSPKEAMIQSQMRVALDYLIYSDLTITQIADALGFSTVHNFSRAVRQHTGKPPSSFR